MEFLILNHIIYSVDVCDKGGDISASGSVIPYEAKNFTAWQHSRLHGIQKYRTVPFG